VGLLVSAMPIQPRTLGTPAVPASQDTCFGDHSQRQTRIPQVKKLTELV
jgi:hypothetical protein